MAIEDNALTMNELRTKYGQDSIESLFPDNIKPLGELMGRLMSDASAIEINKLYIDASLLYMKQVNPTLFSLAVADTIGMGFVRGNSLLNNKAYNDLFAYMLRQYISLADLNLGDIRLARDLN
jgi:hypothetical protein